MNWSVTVPQAKVRASITHFYPFFLCVCEITLFHFKKIKFCFQPILEKQRNANVEVMLDDYRNCMCSS